MIYVARFQHRGPCTNRFLHCLQLASLLLALMLCASIATAAVLRVPSQYPNIQYALICAARGDTVLVAPGTCYENIVWPATQSLRLLSEGGPDATTINGMGVNSVIRFTTAHDSSTVVQGFTITNGQAEFGGGISCVTASPTIAGNRFIANSAMYYGGGIYCSEGQSAPIIRDNLMVDNTVVDGSGGAIAAYLEAYPTIVGNEFRSNHADAYYGGAIHCEHESVYIGPIVIAGNTFVENSAYGGGALSIFNPYSIVPVVRENQFIGNRADYGGGLFSYWSLADVSNCDFRANHANRNGGGIYAEESHDIAVRDCELSENVAVVKGGAMALGPWTSVPEIVGNSIHNNTAGDGAGVYVFMYSEPRLRGNQIIANQANGFGGGVFIERWCAPILEGDVIMDNQAAYAGGVCVNESQMTASDCTIANNAGGGVLFTNAWADHFSEIHQNAIFGHAEYGLVNESPTVVIAADNNWWGDASGPYHPTQNPNGHGNSVSDYVIFDPWSTDPSGVSTVPSQIAGVVRLACAPNPFRGSTTITCGRTPVGSPGSDARIAIYDVGGRLLRSLPVEWRPDGSASVDWSGRDEAGNLVPAGMSIVRLEAGPATRTTKLVRVQ